MITLNTKKEYIIPYKDKEDASLSFSMKFKFPYTEEYKMEKGEDPIQFIARMAKDAVVSTEGIIDSETGAEVVLTEMNRKAIHDLLKTLPDYIMDIAMSYLGPKGKNLLTGATESLSTDGLQANAPSASQTPVTEGMDVSSLPTGC